MHKFHFVSWSANWPTHITSLSNYKHPSSAKPETVSCGGLEPPEKGTIDITSTTPSSTATYSCMLGYMLLGGDSERRCLDNGTWSGTEPSCVGRCVHVCIEIEVCACEYVCMCVCVYVCACMTGVAYRWLPLCQGKQVAIYVCYRPQLERNSHEWANE